MQRTLPSKNKYYSGAAHELDIPSYSWDDRICYLTDKQTRTDCLSDNIIYKAAKKHKVTTAWYEMQRVINTDMVYWWKPSKNLMFIAKISTDVYKRQRYCGRRSGVCLRVMERCENGVMPFGKMSTGQNQLRSDGLWWS